MLDNLALAVKQRCSLDITGTSALVGLRGGNSTHRPAASARASGCIINTAGWVEDLGYQLVLSSIKALEADVVLVLGHDKLYNKLRQDLTPSDGTAASSAAPDSDSAGVSPGGGICKCTSALTARELTRLDLRGPLAQLWCPSRALAVPQHAAERRDGEPVPTESARTSLER